MEMNVVGSFLAQILCDWIIMLADIFLMYVLLYVLWP